MKAVTTQTSFFGNGCNKSRLIEMIRKEFQQQGITSKQAEADADSLIANTGLTLAKTHERPVVVMGTDTDLLVILVSQGTSEMNLHMCGSNPPIVHDIQAIQKSIGDMTTHLMTLHTIFGCDTVSVLFGQGKKKDFLLTQKVKLHMLNIFENRESSRDEIACAGKKFLLKLYGADQVQTLDKFRYTCYNHQSVKCHGHLHLS